MDLGDLIRTLECFDPSMSVWLGWEGRTYPPGEFASWRGVYAELTLTPGVEPVTVGELLDRCRAADGAVFEGWKGGEFTMGRGTKVWADEEGSANGEALQGVVRTGDNALVIRTALERGY